MDKVKHFQKVILQFMEQYMVETNGYADQEVRRRILADYEHNSFQLLSAGWRGTHFIFGPIFHFDIIDGKIWLQCNNTEREVVDELMANGVDKKDIVLGFILPQARHYTGFAVA